MPAVACPTHRSEVALFRPIDPKQDLVELEHEVLELWRDRRTFARLRAQLEGGPRWSFLDGPITANNPMGVHHAWGRSYKDIYQRYHAMLGHDQRSLPAFCARRRANVWRSCQCASISCSSAGRSG